MIKQHIGIITAYWAVKFSSSMIINQMGNKSDVEYTTIQVFFNKKLFDLFVFPEIFIYDSMNHTKQGQAQMEGMHTNISSNWQVFFENHIFMFWQA